MTQPRKYLIRMVVFLMAVVVLCGVLFLPLQKAFLANAPLNGFIVGVLLLGILYNFRQVLMLYPEVAWIVGFRQDGAAAASEPHPPKLLAPMATMVGDHRDRLSLSTLAMRSLLDGIVSRLDESRDLSRYTIGLLIFLGLLGTFWGLLETVASIGDVISGLSVQGGDAVTVFGDLKKGLQAPMTGMGTAFSSSLFGLAGSLVLGFLDLQANQAQNRFYNDLEEWLSTVTRLATGSALAESDQPIPAYVQALLEQTAEGLENLQRTLTRGEESRQSVDAKIVSLGEKLETLTDHMRTEQALMKSLAETQIEIKPVLAQLASATGSGAGGMDERTRTHIRNLDNHLSRLADEMSSGREDLIQQLRNEIKLLARTIAASGGNPGDD
ncbi:MAG: flagellar motor protein MotA [Rhodospirillales bacterium]|nr:flagellar motor protein MotA [Alphaproteobacteria bacterium]MBL6947923.1 flagellar motor protein MotA [Rhodospirillales bacterium]